MFVTGVFGQGLSLEQPKPNLCSSRRIHHSIDSVGYFLSWKEPGMETTYLDWLDARNWCRHRCMDLIAFENPKEYSWAKETIIQDNIRFFWTSGRKCDFGDSCNRPDLQPVNVNGWFWSSSDKKIAPTNLRNTITNDWSFTGGDGRPQPDNHENQLGGESESCLAVLNNFYDDGVKWHDVGCSHRKGFICEDSPQLLAFVGRTNTSSINNGPINNSQINNGSIHNSLINIGPINTRPTNTRPINNGPINDSQINNGPIHNSLINIGLISTRPINTGPNNTRPINNGPIKNSQINNGPINNSLINIGPIDTRPFNTHWHNKWNKLTQHIHRVH